MPRIAKLHADPTAPSRGRLFAATAVVAILGAAWARAAENTVIDLTYDSVMDMVRPEVHPHIVVHHNLHVTISGQGNLAEHRDRSTKQYSDQNAMAQVLNSSGDDTAYALWKIAPDGRLLRIEDDPQSTRTMTVTLLPNNKCRLDVVDQLKPGFTEWALLRISTHTLGYYSSYRVTNSSCSVRSAAQ